MTTSHTKGPWSWGRDPSHFDAPEVVKADGAFYVGANINDARLIAAAPNMLEALKQILRNFENQNLPHTDFRVCAAQVADAAIKEAEGFEMQNRHNPGLALSEAQISYMVKRFLMWRLPANFAPDNGISFDRLGNYGTPYEYNRTPTGTNLLTATQAEAMVRHMLEGIPHG